MSDQDNMNQIAHDAFLHTNPVLEQVKTINGVIEFMGLEFNKLNFEGRLPWQNVVKSIVAPNLTSNTGGIRVGTIYGPATLEILETKERNIDCQCFDTCTHNFYYIGTRANNGHGGAMHDLQ